MGGGDVHTKAFLLMCDAAALQPPFGEFMGYNACKVHFVLFQVKSLLTNKHTSNKHHGAPFFFEAKGNPDNNKQIQGEKNNHS